MVAFRDLGSRSIGSPLILSVSRTASWPSTGMSLRTRLPGKNQKAGYPCLGTASVS